MSKESIIRELPDQFVAMMRNWAKTGACIGLYTISPAYQGMPNSSTFGPRIPSLAGECSHVDLALDRLPNRERLAVRLFWVTEGQADLVWLGERLRIDYRTVEKRIRRGHELLRQHLATLEAIHERALERSAAGAANYASQP